MVKYIWIISVTIALIFNSLNVEAKKEETKKELPKTTENYLKLPNSTAWTNETSKKYQKLLKLGYDKDLAKYMINWCKAQSTNPAHCVITAWFIGKNESNAGQNANKNNVWWIDPGVTYKSKEANFDRWLKSYLKHWFKTTHPIDFYPPAGKKSLTNYCTDEVSSHSSVGCPRWLEISTKAFLFLKS